MLKKETAVLQHELATYCLTGKKPSTTEINHSRLPHYHRLVNTIIEDALAQAYPITKSILSKENWETLTLDFIQNNKCAEPQLYLMPKELIAFCLNNNYVQKFETPYLIDLLNFEWIEVAIHSMKDEPILESFEGDYLHSKLYLNPYIEFLKLSYPIHTIKNAQISYSPSPTYLLIYRENNGTVQYTELNEFTYSIISQIAQLDLTLKQALEGFLETLNTLEQILVIEQAKHLIFELKKLGIVIGVRE